jgi:hypothetical protein
MVFRQKLQKERLVFCALSLALQSTIGLFLGHQHDMQIFYATGYEVFNGATPYSILPVSSIFNRSDFLDSVPSIGYPPLWALYLGVVYGLVYLPTKNLFVYNLAIKLPSIISNVALAFLVEQIAIHEGLDRKTSNKMFYVLLFNPFMIYISAAWGQFDSIVALTTILALNELYRGKIGRSSIFIALSISLKIIPLILVPVFLLFIIRNYDLKFISKFTVGSVVAFTTFSYLPFRIFGWDPGFILNNLQDPFNRAGCFTFFNIFELLKDRVSLPQEWAFLGYLWIPSLIIGYSCLSRTSLNSKNDLFRWSSSILFVLMLTRSWVSEQNVVLLVPMVMLVSVINFEGWRISHLAWIIALIFTFLNTSPFQLFFLVSPKPYLWIKSVDESFRTSRLILRFLAVIPWQIVGWHYFRRTINARRLSLRLP